MKPQDLMFGDWVIVYEKAMPVKARVEGVFERGATVLGRVRIADHGFMEPIPLTPEILEKNGFEIDFEDGSLIWVDEQDVTEVVWGGTILTIHGANGHLELDTCMYVHELQHALRMCGVDKEITL